MKLILALLILAPAPTFADITGFYSETTINEFQDTSVVDHELKDLLHQVEQKDHTSITYREARWQLYTNIYLNFDKDGKPFIVDVYCEKVITKNVNVSNLPYGTKTNIEHTWPQSKFNPKYDKDSQKTDLHHLFIANTHANGLRGHQYFGEVSIFYDRKGKCKNSGLGLLVKPPTNVAWSSNDFYEPPAQHRGNIARALFYFAIRYKLKINDTQEYFLRKWHKEDPVSELDTIRNGKIQAIQGNRNPFIDFPELVDRIKNF